MRVFYPDLGTEVESLAEAMKQVKPGDVIFVLCDGSDQYAKAVWEAFITGMHEMKQEGDEDERAGGAI